jgi:enhancer of polycomb-like protein
LKLINAKLPPGQAISEDQFEEVMNFFEETAATKQPFAAVDNAPVLPLEELLDQLDDSVPPSIGTFAKYVYDHWKARRSATGNRGLAPRLKFETGQESDDSDPYVCFRRRELRQIRKTRNRDAQGAEKLRKLRMELETARGMLMMVKRREMVRKDSLEIDRLVFEQRLAFRDTKRKLGLTKGDEDLLINQKVIISLSKDERQDGLTFVTEDETAAWHDAQSSRSRPAAQDAHGFWSSQRARYPKGNPKQCRQAHQME